MGYTAISTNNWKGLKEVGVCFSPEKVSEVAAMSLVASVWPNSSKVYSTFGPNPRKHFDKNFHYRFFQK